LLSAFSWPSFIACSCWLTQNTQDMVLLNKRTNFVKVLLEEAPEPEEADSDSVEHDAESCKMVKFPAGRITRSDKQNEGSRGAAIIAQ
jgi:hypothetical protein